MINLESINRAQQLGLHVEHVSKYAYGQIALLLYPNLFNMGVKVTGTKVLGTFGAEERKFHMRKSFMERKFLDRSFPGSKSSIE